LDADDEWLPSYLATGIKTLDEHGHDVVTTTCGFIEFPAGLSTFSMWQKRGIVAGVQRISPTMSPVLLSHMLAYMSPCSTIARAAMVRRYGGFVDTQGCRFGEDATLWLKVLLNERVHFSTEPLACFHRETSGLSGNYTHARPIEPFLKEPREVMSVCPRSLMPLLARFYATRTCKAATMLGSWGNWREARDLVDKFVTWRDWRLPYFAAALFGCTRLGSFAGRNLRRASEGLGFPRIRNARSHLPESQPPKSSV
jgi:hypothetical protein